MSANRLLRTLRRIPGLYAVAVFLTGRRAVVHGSSMHPTLLPADRVLFDRLHYLLAPPVAGDIVLARHPSRPGVLFIKRVASEHASGIHPDPERASAGEASPPLPSAPESGPGVGFIERVASERGSGIYPDPERASASEAFPPLPSLRERGPEGEAYWLLGDNPDESTDSRRLGSFRREDILARAWLVYWPPNRARRLHP